jgi:hypothetical protein
MTPTLKFRSLRSALIAAFVRRFTAAANIPVADQGLLALYQWSIRGCRLSNPSSHFRSAGVRAGGRRSGVGSAELKPRT